MRILLFYLLCLLSLNGNSNSPLTSIFFAKAYNDVPIIEDLIKHQDEIFSKKIKLTDAHIRFLGDQKHPIDQRIALINALGTGNSGNTEIFKRQLTLRYKLISATLDTILSEPILPGEGLCYSSKKINPEDLLLLGYLQAMGEPESPMKAFKCAYHPAMSRLNSEVFVYVLTLIRAQNLYEVDWCSVYTDFYELRKLDSMKDDKFRPEALKIIHDYFEERKNECDIVSSSDIFSKEYWNENPVCNKNTSQNGNTTEKTIDLILVTKQKGENFEEQFVQALPGSAGSIIHVQVSNQGNTSSIESNIELSFNTKTPGSRILYYQVVLPSIAAGKSEVMEIKIPGYWLFDPDADFTITIDALNIIEETDEKNNSSDFYQKG